jgi:hypothetical protein
LDSAALAWPDEIAVEVDAALIPPPALGHAPWKGMCSSSAELHTKPEQIARLYMHEASRVYCDRLVSPTEREAFAEILGLAVSSHFGDYDMAMIQAEPNIFLTFTEEAEGSGQKMYTQVADYDHLSRIVTSQLERYHTEHAQMSLVLFKDCLTVEGSRARFVMTSSLNGSPTFSRARSRLPTARM